MEVILVLLVVLNLIGTAILFWFVKTMEGEMHQVLRQTRATRDIVEMSRRGD